MSEIEKSVLNRNSTNFAISLFEKLKSYKFDSDYKYLFYYQYIVTKYINDIDIKSRGLLIYHTMGMGKSILAVALAMSLRDDYEPIIMLSKSLEANFRDSIVKFLKMAAKEGEYTQLGNMPDEDIRSWIKRNFSFVSMNASNMITQITRATEATVDFKTKKMEQRLANVVRLGSLDGKVLIVDEAHNLFRAIINGSKNGVELYDMIMRAKDAKVIFLTGTPVSNHPFELVPCFNMLVGTKALPVLPENWNDFGSYFIDSKTNTIKNKQKFQNRIMGLVSHITHTSNPGAAADINVAKKNVEFPTELPIKVEKIPMVATQYVKYLLARDKELAEIKGFARSGDTPNLQKPKSDFTSSYRVRSRQISNFAIPDSAKLAKEPEEVPIEDSYSPKFEAIRKNIENGVGVDLVYSQFIGIGGLKMFARYLEHNGYKEISVGLKKSKSRTAKSVKDEVLPNNSLQAVEEISDLQRRATVKETPEGLVVKGSSEFNWYDSGDDESGDDESGDDESGDESSNVSSNAKITKAKTFAFIIGDVDPDDRNKILQMFNDDNNKHGEVISLLLISSTGAEGLDCKNVRRVHIMEPYWSHSRHAQVISRAVRNDSHIALPQDEKNVQPFIYLAINPDRKVDTATEESNTATEESNTTTSPTTDEELYNRSLADFTLNEQFTQAIKEVSIECMLNGESYCRVCSPTNLPLYSNNILLDIKSADSCVKAVEKTVNAEEILVNGDKYYYKSSSDSIYGYDIFIHDEELNTFRKMNEDNPLFKKIAKEIKKHNRSAKNNEVAED